MFLHEAFLQDSPPTANAMRRKVSCAHTFQGGQCLQSCRVRLTARVVPQSREAFRRGQYGWPVLAPSGPDAVLPEKSSERHPRSVYTCQQKPPLLRSLRAIWYVGRSWLQRWAQTARHGAWRGVRNHCLILHRIHVGLTYHSTPGQTSFITRLPCKATRAAASDASQHSQRESASRPTRLTMETMWLATSPMMEGRNRWCSTTNACSCEKTAGGHSPKNQCMN